MRHSRHHKRSGDRSFTRLVNGLSIHDRPKSIEARKHLGLCEGDLVPGSQNSHIATLVERKARYTFIVKLQGKDANSVYEALLNVFTKLPAKYRKSLTRDRGMELARHAELTKQTGMPVCFCDPQSPWQRGLNENTNGLIWQYFPKKTNLAKHTQNDLDRFASQFNERSRKVLKYKAPLQMIRGVALSA